MGYGLQEIWCYHLNKLIGVHEAVISLPDNVVQMLIAVHTLSVCDSARKMGAKFQVFKVPFKLGYAPVNLFGVETLDGPMYKTIEHFLLKRMSSVGTSKEDSFGFCDFQNMIPLSTN